MASSTNKPIHAEAVPTDLSENERCLLLSDERRRTAVDVLTDRQTPVSLRDVAFAVASQEQDVGMPDEQTVEQVAISLHHHHLPKMTELGVIDYDTMSKRIVGSEFCGE